MATRISLVRSMRQREQREQIGELFSSFCRALIDLESRCLIHLSSAARKASHPQIALNSITRAQDLHRHHGPEVLQEFANVLWLMSEPKLAFQYLVTLTQHSADNMEVDKGVKMASLLARLVRIYLHSKRGFLLLTGYQRGLGALRHHLTIP